MLTADRANSGMTVLNSARIVLEVLRERGEHSILIGDLPEKLAVLEGVLCEAWEALYAS